MVLEFGWGRWLQRFRADGAKKWNEFPFVFLRVLRATLKTRHHRLPVVNEGN